jgi:K+-sensing histidine kinase KdpD
MGPVIACVDGSDVSLPVVRIAQQLAERLEVGLVLLHVAPPTEAPGVSAAAPCPCVIASKDAAERPFLVSTP